MMCFPCDVCGRPSTVAAIHAWSLDLCACSRACAAQLPPREPPERAAALDRVIDLLAQGVHTIDYAIREARPLASQADAAVAGRVAAGLLLGSLGGAIVGGELQDAAERKRGRYQDVLWTIDQQLIVIARQLMVLHALGYAIAAQMPPLVVDHDTLVTPSTIAPPSQLVTIRELLIHLHGGVSGWRHALG